MGEDGDPLLFTAGDSNATSAGVRIFGGTLADFTLRHIEAYGGVAPFTAGVAFQGGNPSNLSLRDSALLGGVSDVDAAEGVSAGLWFAGDCSGCLIDGNAIAGFSSQTAGRSVGIRMAVRNALALNTTLITNNLVGGGEGTTTHAFEIGGNGAEEVRVLHNYLYGGGGSDESAAVYLRQVGDNVVVSGVDTPAVFGGNILDAGDGADAYGFFEQCRSNGVTARRTEPARAANSNFFPVTGVTALVRRADNTGGTCASVDVTSVAAVNGTGPYAVVGDCGEHYGVDPAFADDPLTDPTAGNATLQDAADMTYACAGDATWAPLFPDGAQMTDYFDTIRLVPDIGAYEVP